MTRVALILAGCGYLDGAEIQEAVCTLLALERAGIAYRSFAPDIEQFHVVDHSSGEVDSSADRNVLQESARIVRGDLAPLQDLQPGDFDALVMPGGFGVAKNLCTFAVDGPDCQVHPQMAELVRGFHAAGKPIVALCIAPALIAKVLGDGVELTLGTDDGMAEALNILGATPQKAAETEIVIDQRHRVISSPCYLFDDATVAQIATSTERAVQALLDLLAHYKN